MPSFWGMGVVVLALVLLVLLSLVCCAVYTPIQRESGNWVPRRRLFSPIYIRCERDAGLDSHYGPGRTSRRHAVL